jgi:alpha-beta hydrolase superfamily lysophospholipase
LLCCCTKSESQRNTAAGLEHSDVTRSGALAWPAGGADPSVPQGVHFPAQGDTRATLVCLHGIQTHAAWFAPLAGELAKSGIHVIAVDRRGSGTNTAKPFIKGHAAGADELMEDLQKQITEAQRLGAPVYLLGTSWGSNLAGVYAARGTNPQPKGVIQLVPATRSRFETPAKALFVSVFSFLAPRLKAGLPFEPDHYQAAAPQPPPTDNGRAPLKKPKDNEASGPNEKLAELLKNDGSKGVLVIKPSFRLLRTGLKLAREWREPPQKRDFPLLLLVAERDQIMDNGPAWVAAERNTTRHTRKIIPGAGHGAQITHPKEIAADILNWIAAIDTLVAPARES